MNRGYTDRLFVLYSIDIDSNLTFTSNELQSSAISKNTLMLIRNDTFLCYIVPKLRSFDYQAQRNGSHFVFEPKTRCCHGEI